MLSGKKAWWVARKIKPVVKHDWWDVDTEEFECVYLAEGDELYERLTLPSG